MPDSPPRSATLVGRVDELAALQRLVGLDGEAAPARAVLLAGDAGVGKTRLLDELRARAAAAGWRVLVGHCLDFGGDWLPYLPFSDALGRLVAEAPEQAHELLATSPALARLLPGHRLLGGDSEPGAAQPDGDQPRAQLFEAVPLALEQLGRAAPVLLVLEDVHWADPSTRELLGLLLTRESAARCVLVASYRADDLHRRHPLRADVAHWSRLRGVARVHLQPLPDPDVRTLVRALDPAGLPDDAVDGIVARAEGNAFFTEELVSAAARGEQVLSPDVTDVLLLHLDALDGPARTALRAMSVAGRRVSHDLLARVLAGEVDDLDGALRAAVDRNLLVAGDQGYAFRHALLAEAVYGDLLPGERVRWHRTYAEALAVVPPGGRAEGTAAELARHALAAGDLATAVAASVAAGDEAGAVGGPAEATRHYEQALTLLAGSGPTAGVDPVELALRACASATAAGWLQRARALVEDALAALPASAEPVVRARLLVAVASTALLEDAPIDVLALTAEALRLAPEGALRAEAMAVHARACWSRSRVEEAARWAGRAVELATALGLPALLADATTTLTRATWGTDLPQAEAALRRSTAEARAAGDAPAELRGTHALGGVLYELGLHEPAQAAYEQAAARAVEMRRPWAPYGVDGRAMASVVSYTRGRWDEARRLSATDGEDPPDLARTVLTAVGLAVAAGRGETEALALLPALRPAWHRDGFVAVATAAAGIDLLGDADRLDDAVALHDEAVAVLTALWESPDVQARVRLSGLLLGQLAGHAATTPSGRRAALVRDGQALVDAAERAYDAAARNGPESQAWRSRVRAEQLRLRRAVGQDVPADELVAAWREAVDGAVRFGHVFETARARTRLAAALRAAGARAEAVEQEAAATETARALGARPLLRELRAATLPAGPTGPTALTAREAEVLALVAEGRSNREIGLALFIAPKTVSVHVSNVLAKLQAAGRTEAVAIARRRGLLVP